MLPQMRIDSTNVATVSKQNQQSWLVGVHATLSVQIPRSADVSCALTLAPEDQQPLPMAGSSIGCAGCSAKGLATGGRLGGQDSAPLFHKLRLHDAALIRMR